ncbi:MAG TPA: hypothetical protein V6D33_12585 [Cyanophyceae cyanobacterium]
MKNLKGLKHAKNDLQSMVRGMRSQGRYPVNRQHLETARFRRRREFIYGL